MFSNKRKTVMALAFLALIVTACGGGKSFDQQVAVVVSLTQTAAAIQAPATAASAPTQVIGEAGSYQPLNADECLGIQNALSQATGVNATVLNPAPSTDFAKGKSGSGCQVTFSATGNTKLDAPIIDALKGMGYTENMDYAAAGPGAIAGGYQKADALCLFVARSAPANPSQCPKGSDYYMCMGNLPADQILRTVTVNCARPTP